MTIRTAISRALIVIGALLALAIIVFCSFPPLRAQTTTQTHDNPDCQFFFTFTAATNSLPTGSGFDQRQQGCNTWSIVYFNSGFSALSLLFQSAPNNNGVAGNWGTGFPVQQTIVAGSNPQTNTTGGFLWIVGQNAFTRVQLTSATGSGIVTGAAFGWRIPNAQ
jgi:hypothetical protein